MISRLRRFSRRLAGRLRRVLELDDRARPLRYRSIFLLPTRSGLFFLLMLFVMWIAAINYGNSMGLALCFLLVGLGIVFTLHCFRNLLGLRVATGSPAPVFAGEPARFPIRLENTSGRARLDLELAGPRTRHAQLDLPPGASDEAHVDVVTTHRGRLAAPMIALATRYPGGLVKAWSWLQPTVTAIVYPAPEQQAPPPQAAPALAESWNSLLGDEEYVGVREYQPGDALHRIDWRAIARGLPAQTKQFAEGQADELWFDWDSLSGLDTERRLARLCRWIIDAERGGSQRYGLRLPQRSYGPDRGAAHYHRCLRALALHDA